MTRTQTFAAFGYPAEASRYSGSLPFNGAYQREATSASSGAGDNIYSGWVGPNAMMIKSYMTEGCSGGGWLIALGSNGLGHVNGHNDYHYASGPKVNPSHMFSPYYGPEALNLFNFSRKL